MRPIFATSDYHFNHKKIIEYCDRPFRSVEEMNDLMIRRWNKVVPDEARVYYLGDFGWGNKEMILTLMCELNFDQLIWIPGNHDRSVTWCDDIEPEVFCMKGPIELPLNGVRYILSHEPVMGWAGSVNLHGHVHNDHFIEIDGYGYPDGPFKQRMRFNVGVDCNRFRPWRLSEIEAEIRKARK